MCQVLFIKLYIHLSSQPSGVDSFIIPILYMRKTEAHNLLNNMLGVPVLLKNRYAIQALAAQRFYSLPHFSFPGSSVLGEEEDPEILRGPGSGRTTCLNSSPTQDRFPTPALTMGSRKITEQEMHFRSLVADCDRCVSLKWHDRVGARGTEATYSLWAFVASSLKCRC